MSMNLIAHGLRIQGQSIVREWETEIQMNLAQSVHKDEPAFFIGDTNNFKVKLQYTFAPEIPASDYEPGCGPCVEFIKCEVLADEKWHLANWVIPFIADKVMDEIIEVHH